MSSENLDTPEMNGRPGSLSDMNGHPDSFAATPETKGPSDKAASPAIQIDIPLSDPSGDTESPTSNGQADYIVGHGKPPEANRFKKGQSGNPSGRPAGRRNVRSEFEQALTQSVTVTLHGAQQSPSLVTAILYKLCEKALKGDQRAAEFVLKSAKEFGIFHNNPTFEELSKGLLYKSEDE